MNRIASDMSYQLSRTHLKINNALNDKKVTISEIDEIADQFSQARVLSKYAINTLKFNFEVDTNHLGDIVDDGEVLYQIHQDISDGQPLNHQLLNTYNKKLGLVEKYFLNNKEFIGGEKEKVQQVFKQFNQAYEEQFK